VTEDSKRIPPAPCPGDPHNCKLLLSSQEAYHGRSAQAEICGHEAVVSAMAVGLVIDVWRNGPVEDMHCGKRGPDDAAMFAESTSLHDRAVTALTAGNRPIDLLEFEDHLLDRQRPWAGTGGRTLQDLGYGFLGQYRRHVKDHINRLLDLGHHTCVSDPLEPFLVTTALLYGRRHKGMPRWPVIVERIGILLANPAHAEWGQDGEGVRALAEMPPETPSSEGLAAALLSAPSGLPVTVLEWLSHHLLYCAAPPYSLRWDEQSHRTRLHDAQIAARCRSVGSTPTCRLS
jgi:hypothetical protein